LKKRLKVLVKGQDVAGEFYRRTFFGLFAYVTNRIPEISDEVYRIDAALCAGFGWEIGPFEMWDAMGVEDTLKAMETAGRKPAAWVSEMLAKGNKTFYKTENGKRKYYDIPSGTYKVIPGTESYIILDSLRETNKVWGNSGTTLFDIGDGVLNLEFHTKMNTMGGEVVAGINKAIEIAEKDFKGLVVGNQGINFRQEQIWLYF
jgi:3-hydroxyacyl-CoA dehydrogenase